MNLFGENMIPNNDVDTFRSAIRTDGGYDSGRAAADQGNAIGPIEIPLLTNRPILYMSATWGN